MIHVVVDDLAFVEADAVLRPADASLGPLSPAMTRLDRQAGARFLEARQVTQPLAAGSAVVTPAGDLPAEFVVHVVLQDADTPASATTVRRALASAWEQAARWGLEEVATPLVGAGPGQLALEEAAALLVESLPAAGAPGRLRIVCEHATEQAAVEAVVRRLRR